MPIPPIDLASIFKPVSVNISANQNGTGYTVLYDGNPNLEVPVLNKDTVLYFKLDSATASNIYFVGMVSNLRRDMPQLSSYSISVDRRVLICTDVDSSSVPLVFDVTLQWVIGNLLSHDPQVRNTPG